MKLVIAFCVIAVACAQRRNVSPTGDYDGYAASLAGAPVGTFERNSDVFGGSEVTGSSLAGAKAGIVGKNRNSPLPFRGATAVDPFFPGGIPRLPLGAGYYHPYGSVGANPFYG